MHGVAVPFFELLTIGLMLRALRRQRLMDYTLAGLSLGMGLCFYSPLRLFPASDWPVLVGFVVCAVMILSAPPGVGCFSSAWACSLPLYQCPGLRFFSRKFSLIECESRRYSKAKRPKRAGQLSRKLPASIS